MREWLHKTLMVHLQLVSVGQAAPDSQKYFKEHMPGWQRVKLQKIHVLQYLCVMDERKNRGQSK